MSLALYRKYRPGTLSEVIGQDHVVEPLKRALKNDRVHHAYLFSGPRGCGKTSSARILARSLNCEQGPTPDPCGVCNSCIELAPNGPGSIDVIELDAATHGLVDDARDLREKAVYAPASSRYKIYIIDEAHQLGPGAANALLKLVEEPPPHLRFVFATTEPDKIIGTIRSRTHHYGFRLVPARTLAQHLSSICESEGLHADPGALALVSRAAGGSVRDSLSILGQLLAGAGEEGLTYDEAAEQLGVTNVALIDEVVNAMAVYDAAALFRAVDAVVESGHDPRRFVTDLLERFRDLLIVAGVPDAAEAGLITGPVERIGELNEQASRFGPGELSRNADLISKGLSEIKGATAPRLQLELLVARLALPAADSGPQTLLARLEALEKSGVAVGTAPTAVSASGSGSGSPAVPAGQPVPAAVSAAAQTTTQAPAVRAGDQSAAAAKPARSRSFDGPPAPPKLSEIAPSSGNSPAAVEAPPAPSAASAQAPEASAVSPAAPAQTSAAPAAPPAHASEAPAAPHTALAQTPQVPALDAASAQASEVPQVAPQTSQPARTQGEAQVDAEPAHVPQASGPGASAQGFDSPVHSEPQPHATQPQGHAAAASDGLSIEHVRALWPSVIEDVKARSKVAWVMLMNAYPVAVEGDVVVVSHEDPGTVKRFSQSSAHDEKLNESTRSVLGTTLSIRMVNVDAAEAKAGSNPVHEAPAQTQEEEISESIDVSDGDGIELLQKHLGGVKISERDEE